MILADTSAWVEYDRATGSAVDLRLAELIATDGPVAVTDFEGAARIYRRCRQAGITPRGLVDCMIAAVARRHQATLLTRDADLNRVARVIGIELDQPAQPEPPQPT